MASDSLSHLILFACSVIPPMIVVIVLASFIHCVLTILRRRIQVTESEYSDTESQELLISAEHLDQPQLTLENNLST